MSIEAYRREADAIRERARDRAASVAVRALSEMETIASQTEAALNAAARKHGVNVRPSAEVSFDVRKDLGRMAGKALFYGLDVKDGSR